MQCSCMLYVDDIITAYITIMYDDLKQLSYNLHANSRNVFYGEACERSFVVNLNANNIAQLFVWFGWTLSNIPSL